MAIGKNTKFWLSRASIILGVIVLAVMFVAYKPSPSAALSGVSGIGAKHDEGIAASVTRFYSEFRQTSNNRIEDRFGEDTILLDEQNDEALSDVIENVSPKTYRSIDNWEGNYKERAFSAHSTLMQEARLHIASEGFNLVWDLEQDFNVRHRYQTTSTLVGMLEEIADAVDSNFNKPIAVYFCSDKRALVLTVRESAYLRAHCQKSMGSFQYY